MDDLLAAQDEFERAIQSHNKQGDEQIINDEINNFLV
jgi:hypothetical protein